MYGRLPSLFARGAVATRPSNGDDEIKSGLRVKDAHDNVGKCNANVDLTGVPELLQNFASRAESAGWDIEWRVLLSDELPRLIVSIPNGRYRRRRVISLMRAKALAHQPLESLRFLGNYEAINYITEDCIEGGIRVASRTTRSGLADLPGVEIFEGSEGSSASADESDAVDEMADPNIDRRRAIDAGAKWRLKIESPTQPCSIEFSEASDVFLSIGRTVPMPPRRLNNSTITLKIRGISAQGHDETLQRFEDIVGAVFFDLDLRYGIHVALTRQMVRLPSNGLRNRTLEGAPTFPRLRYPAEALSLYWYGRSASGMPLLQFLAYYQVLEYFFPMYYRQHALRRMRQEITDPRFNATDDGHLAKLLNIIAPDGRISIASERDQLKATISGCVDEATLRSFLEEDEGRIELLKNKKALKGIPTVVDDGHRGSLLDQAAERIYKIRCRVVHAKADGGDSNSELLLPSGPEADSLHVDVEVLQYLAQKAIVAGGVPLT